MSESLLENYNPLYDVHLRQYFSLPHMQKHLRRMGLLDSNGVPVARNGNVESELYARHHAMMEMMLKNRERILIQLADLQKKYDAAEKVEIYRKIRSGLTNTDELQRNNLSRSLSRPRRAATQPVKGSRRRTASTTSFEDTEMIKRIETAYEQPNSAPSFRNTYDRLAAKAFKYQFLHKLDDNTLHNYKDSLLKQLQKLQRFRDVSFGPYSFARHQPSMQTSWFFRRRSLPPLTASNTLHDPTRSLKSIKAGQNEGHPEQKRRQHKSQSPRRYRRFSPAKKAIQNIAGIKLPPLKKEENIKKSTFSQKPVKVQRTEITSSSKENPEKETSGFKGVLAAGAAAVGGAIAAFAATHSDNEDSYEHVEPESPKPEIDSKTRTPTPKSEVEYNHHEEDQGDIPSEEEKYSHHEETSYEHYEQEYKSEPEGERLSPAEQTPDHGRSDEEQEEENAEVEHEYHEEEPAHQEVRAQTPEESHYEEETHEVAHGEERAQTPEEIHQEVRAETPEEPHEEEAHEVTHEEERAQTPEEPHEEEVHEVVHEEVQVQTPEESHYEEETREVTHEEARAQTPEESHYEEERHEVAYEGVRDQTPEESHDEEETHEVVHQEVRVETPEETHEVAHEEVRAQTPEESHYEEERHEVVHEEVRAQTPEETHEVTHEEARAQTPEESHYEEETHEVVHETVQDQAPEESHGVVHEEARAQTPEGPHYDEEEKVEVSHEVVCEAAPDVSYEEEPQEEPEEEVSHDVVTETAPDVSHEEESHEQPQSELEEEPPKEEHDVGLAAVISAGAAAAVEVINEAVSTIAERLTTGEQSPALSQEDQNSPRASPKEEFEYEQHVEPEHQHSDEAHEEFIEKREVKYESEEPVEREEFHHEEHEYVQHEDNHSEHQEDHEEPQQHEHFQAEIENHDEHQDDHEEPQEHEHESEHGYDHEEQTEESIHHEDAHEEPEQYEHHAYDEPVHQDEQEHVEEHREYEETHSVHHEEAAPAEDEPATEHLRESSPDPMQESVYEKIENHALTQDDLSFTASEPDDRDSIHKLESEHVETEDIFNESSDAGFQSQSEPTGDDEDRIEDFERSSSTPVEGRNELAHSDAEQNQSSEFVVIHTETPFEEHEQHHENPEHEQSHENLGSEHDYEIVDSEEQIPHPENVHIPDSESKTFEPERESDILEPPIDSARSLESFEHHEQEIQDNIESEDVVENTSVHQESGEYSTSPAHQNHENPQLLSRPSIEITAASDFGDSQVDDISAPPTPKTPDNKKDEDEEDHENTDAEDQDYGNVQHHYQHQYESHVIHHSNGDSHQLLEDGIDMSDEHSNHREPDSESLRKSDHLPKSEDEQSEVGQGEL